MAPDASVALASPSGKLAALPLVALASGCGFPFDADEYRVVDVSDASVECSVDVPDAGGDADVPRLLAAFAPDDDTCAETLRDSCRIQLSRCAETVGCIELTECAREISDPTAESKCAASLATSLEAHWAYETLRSCWAEQHTRCNVGNDWRCLDGYLPPALDTANVELSQQLQYFLGNPGKSEFDVQLCQALTDCSSPLFEARTDPCSGIYTFDFTSNAEPGRPGAAWEGYRLVTGPAISPSLVVTNLPIRGRRVDVVRLVQDSQIRLLGKGRLAEGAPLVFVQVLDCQSAPAAGVRIRVPTTSTGGVEYPSGAPAAKGTSENGAALVVGMEAGTPQRIIAESFDDSGALTPIAEWEGISTPGTMTYLKLYPEPR